MNFGKLMIKIKNKKVNQETLNITKLMNSVTSICGVRFANGDAFKIIYFIDKVVRNKLEAYIEQATGVN